MEILTALIAAVVAVAGALIAALSSRTESLELERLASTLGKLDPESVAARNLNHAIQNLSERIRRRLARKTNTARLWIVLIVSGVLIILLWPSIASTLEITAVAEWGVLVGAGLIVLGVWGPIIAIAVKTVRS